MATGSSALATPNQEAPESEEGGCSRQYWNTQLAKLEKEVREGRAQMHLLTTAREMYACPWKSRKSEMHHKTAYQTKKGRSQETQSKYFIVYYIIYNCIH